MLRKPGLSALILLLIFVVLSTSCQKSLSKKGSAAVLAEADFTEADFAEADFNEEIYSEADVDVLPEYFWGRNAMYSSIIRNFKMPQEAMRAGVGGRVVVRFVVEKNGTISSLKVIERDGYGYNEEAIRLIKLLEKWKPALKDGKPVRSFMEIPVNLIVK